jgi:hypothetical protein
MALRLVGSVSLQCKMLVSAISALYLRAIATYLGVGSDRLLLNESAEWPTLFIWRSILIYLNRLYHNRATI